MCNTQCKNIVMDRQTMLILTRLLNGAGITLFDLALFMGQSRKFGHVGPEVVQLLVAGGSLK